MKVNVTIYPEKKDNPKDKGFIIKSFINVAKELTKEFKTFIDKEVEVKVYHSSTNMKKDMVGDDSYETKFGDYNDEFKKIYIVHQIVLEPIYGNKTNDKFYKIIKYILTKFFLYEIFVNENNFSLYKKNLINALAMFYSGNYMKDLIHKELLEFDINKNYSSKELIPLFIYSLIFLNGKDYVKEHLQDFFDKSNINRLSETLFNKEPKKIIEIAKERLTLLKKKERNRDIVK